MVNHSPFRQFWGEIDPFGPVFRSKKQPHLRSYLANMDLGGFGPINLHSFREHTLFWFFLTFSHLKRPCGYIFTHLGYRKFCPCFFGSGVKLWSKFDHTSYQTHFCDSKWGLCRDNSVSSQKKLKFEKFEFHKVIIKRLLYRPQKVIFF